MTKERRYYILISALITFFAVLAVGYGVFAFLTLSQKQAAIAERKYYTEKLSEKEQILAELKNRYQKIEPYLPLIDNALPSGKDSSKLLADLDSLARSANLTMTFLKPESAGPSKQKSSTDLSLLQTVKGPFGYEIPLELRVRGSYRNFQEFVQKIENYQRLINIESVEITKQDDQAVPDYIEAIINIKAYLKK